MTTVLSARPEAAPRPRATGLFRAFWRWHFYASFLVIPILFMLATTGLIYLLRFQVEPMLHRDLMVVEPVGTTVQPLSQQLEAVQEAYPGARLLSVTESAALDESTRVSVRVPGEGARDVFVNPHTGEVLGLLDPANTLSGIAVRLHGDLMVGLWGDYVIEVAACWAVIMALTGYYLFFKGRAARLRRLAAKAPGARLRNRHAWVGAAVGAGVLALVVSGLPWTGFWGNKVQELAASNGSSLWGEDPGGASKPVSFLDESLPHSHATDVPWALGKNEVPQVEPDAVSVATVDTAVVVAHREGLSSPLTIALPRGGKGVYSAIGYAFDDPSAEKTVHVNRYSGEVVSEYGYDDYPAVAKVVSQGIGLHEGRSLGLLNFWVTLLFCVGVIFLCLSGPVMWWRRRPSTAKAVGAPTGRMPLARSWPLLIGLVALGVFLPLFGLSLAVVLILDQLVLRRVPLLAQWFNVSP